MDKIKSILSTIAFILLFVWQLPQNIAGAAYYVFLYLRASATVGEYKDVLTILFTGLSASVSLGCFIVLHRDSLELKRHEYGHCIQSRILGPLYLLIIGIPSAYWCIHCKNNLAADPYDFWTERWANKLGGV